MEFMLKMLEKIQLMRSPFFDRLFTGITFLGEEYFAIVVICLVLWCINKKAGYRIGFTYVSSWVLNFVIKEILQVPRPCELDKNIMSVDPEAAGGFSFPSGHTQSIASLSTAVALTFRKQWQYIAGTILILSMAWSRLYLGAHTLMDVAGGAVVGIAWIYTANKIFDYTERTGRYSSFLIIGAPMLVGMGFIQTNDYYKIAGTLTGFMLGYILDSSYINYQIRGRLWQRSLNFLLGMLVLLLIKAAGNKIFGESILADYLRYFLIGIWITLLAPILFNKLWIRGSRSQQTSQIEHTVDKIV